MSHRFLVLCCSFTLDGCFVYNQSNPAAKQDFKIPQDFLTIAQLISRWERRSIVPASSSQQLPGYRRWNVKIQHRCNRRHLSRTFTTKGKFLIFSCSYIFWNNKHLSGCLIHISHGRWPESRATGTSYVCRLHLAQVAAGPFRLSTGFTTKEEKAKEFLEVSHGPKGWPILPIRRTRDTTLNLAKV